MEPPNQPYEAPTQSELRLFHEALEKDRPDLWKLCYPRIYREPSCGPYYSPKEPARQIASVTIKIESNYIGAAEKYEFMVCSHLVQYGVPTFWLSKNMAVAIGKTMPPGDLPWYDMNLPFPACVFMLPKGTLVHPTEGDVSFIAFARLRKMEYHRSPLRKDLYCSENGCMTVLALTMGAAEPGHLFHWNIPLDYYGPTISLPDIDAEDIGHPEFRHDSGLRYYPMTTEDDQMLVMVARYVFGAIMLMQARPDLITLGKLIKKVDRRGDKREFWSPNILGESYQISHAPAEGTHASPRFHWVRGSYRAQPFGPENKQRRQIWIEPYTRGG